MFINLAATTIAPTTAAGANPSSGTMQILTIVGYVVFFGAIMYFLMIRPQKKKQKQEEKMRNDLQVGDEIVTVGGIIGRVISIKEDSIIVESGPDRSKQKFARWAIQQNNAVRDVTK